MWVGGRVVYRPYSYCGDRLFVRASFPLPQIVIEGHIDASMRGEVSVQMVKELSGNRAAAVKTELMKKFSNFNPNQFVVEGMGWDRPADPDDPNNHAKNRRVEIKVIALENPE